ncbi:MAG: apolipoprotein N-acyltransferase [Actinomycetota bacterium]|nr:apolipoprotein N-acyltransferase [Actinomycetota bacterium]
MNPRAASVVALLSGGLLTLAYPEPDVGPLAWIALAPLLLVTRAVTWRRGAWLGLLFGIGFLGSLVAWISIVGWVAWAVLVLKEALFIAAFGALWAILSRALPGWARVVAAAALWAAIELGREVLPVVAFPWGQLAQSQHNLPWMLRVAGLGGGLLLAVVVVAINACVAEAYRAAAGRRVAGAAVWLAATAALVAAPLAIPTSRATGRAIDVAIVQGNVPDRPPSFAKDLEIISSHARLTRELDDEVDLVVWPESSVGIDPDTEPAVKRAMTASADAVGVPMLVGGNHDLPGDRYQVVLFEVAPRAGIVDEFQKVHLVAFGEYVPGRRFLGWIPLLDQVPRDAVPGVESKLFDVAGGSVAPAISYEGDFGRLVRERIALGGRLLVVATNTSTWERSWASAQHVAFSQVRAAENGVWVVHAALSGISAFVAPDGTVTESTGLYETTTVVEDVTFAREVTVYARAGDWVMIVVWALSVAAVVVGARRARTPGRARDA